MWQKIKNIGHLIKAILANIWYRFPSKQMVVVGVTGTDGKTTTASLIFHILREDKKKAALISTVSAIIGDKEFDTGFHVSTPDALELQSYIKKARDAGVTHLVLEVTSHALDQNRVYGIPFAIGVLTNISREHLDYHQTMENYMKTKAKLLCQSKIAVLNKDDQYFDFFANLLQDHSFKTYGLNKDADINPAVYPLQVKLLGKFNKYNVFAAAAVADCLGISRSVVQKAVNSFSLPQGRCEVVYAKNFSVIIDFAHTPNGIKNILEAISQEKQKGRIIHVFGSAGERDKGKREEMGKISSEYADIIILTAEDPRKERVEDIISDIQQGIKDEEKQIYVIPDRQKAITKAINIAQKGDFVVITGKGHEKSMNFGKGELPWSDHEAVNNALQSLNLQ
ncbi:MAG: UDP-N-acetylmuramoyl-L-alanyl-D-glutamate--2,6-diaminopimelate ligase [Patescibacteria group bacterium]|nr:MAG: UDP-N-acetylmuramoyl-L-alanyl-D-glutamate--2,6-diaminopimelate ligase [Patescibacteria group bacterium]